MFLIASHALAQTFKQLHKRAKKIQKENEINKREKKYREITLLPPPVLQKLITREVPGEKIAVKKALAGLEKWDGRDRVVDLSSRIVSGLPGEVP